MSTTTPATTSAAILSVDRVTKTFPGVVALDDVSFKIERGSFHAVCGENGAGKSTLMKILSGVLTEYDGTIHIDGDPVHFGGTADAEAAGVSIIHQELNLVEELSVAANIFLGRERTTRCGFLDEAAMRSEAAELLSRLECDIRPEMLVGTLRVGDQQLVEIAKALSVESRVLIMDEPTSALTETEVERLFRVIDRLLAGGVTIVYISHKMAEVFRRSDRVTILRDGKHVATRPTSELTPDAVTELMVGREIAAAAFEPRTPGEVVLDVERLSLPWPGHARGYRLKDVSLTVRAGEVVGIAGLMGAGRTELLEAVSGCGAERPTGVVRLFGQEVRPSHPAEALGLGIALVTEDRKRLGVLPHFTVRENITLCTLDRHRRGLLLSLAELRSAACQSVAALGIRTPSTEVPITTLSGGNQQKCVIARALRTEPQVLLLDDPTRGVDVGAKAELYRIIDELARSGMAVVVTSSELPELIALADRIVVLCEGQRTGEFARDEFSEERIIRAATAVG